jgi:hypothetical protein
MSNSGLTAIQTKWLAFNGLPTDDPQTAVGGLIDEVLSLRAALAAAQLPDHVTVTEYTVSLLPDDASLNYKDYAVRVRYEGAGLWSVRNQDHTLVAVFHRWTREGDLLLSAAERRMCFRYTSLAEAIAAAAAAAPGVTVGGRTAAQVLGGGA